jgi:hypothetical protein
MCNSFVLIGLHYGTKTEIKNKGAVVKKSRSADANL